MGLIELWNEILDFSLLARFGISLIFIASAVFCYGLTWYLQKESMIEFGYPKRSRKAMNKIWKKYSIKEKILLCKLRKNAQHKGFFLTFCWIINLVNLFCIVVTCFGLAIFIVFGRYGWSAVLSLILPFAALLLQGGIHFIPNLIWLPSERERYF